MTDNTYWEEIERYFSKKRGKALILSPKDWPLVTSWQEQGIPIEIILQGIDQAFVRAEEQNRAAHRRKTRTLAFCRAEIEALWQAQGTAIQPAAPLAESETDQLLRAERHKVTTKIRSVITQLQKLVEKPHYQCVQRFLRLSSETLEQLLPAVQQAENEATLTQIKQQVRQLEQQFITQLEQSIPPERYQELLQQAEIPLTGYKQNMKPPVYQETLRIAFLQVLRDAYPLPSFL